MDEVISQKRWHQPLSHTSTVANCSWLLCAHSPCAAFLTLGCPSFRAPLHHTHMWPDRQTGASRYSYNSMLPAPVFSNWEKVVTSALGLAMALIIAHTTGINYTCYHSCNCFACELLIQLFPICIRTHVISIKINSMSASTIWSSRHKLHEARPSANWSSHKY